MQGLGCGASQHRLENAYQSLLDGEYSDAKQRSDPKHVGDVQEAREALLTRNVPLAYDYVELSPTSFLSVTASLTPFSNHNQSPRYVANIHILPAGCTGALLERGENCSAMQLTNLLASMHAIPTLLWTVLLQKYLPMSNA